MSDEPKFFYDKFEIENARSFSFWKGVALGGGAVFLILLAVGIFLP